MVSAKIMPDFPQPIGQTVAMELLDAAIARQRIAPAYLFAGPEGVGRSMAARYFARLLLTFDRPDERDKQLENHPDLLWVEPTYLHDGQRFTPREAEEKGLKRRGSPQIRLEQVRDIGKFLSRPPLEASRSVVVLEGAQTMGEGAANGLLKTLEEPGRATLILMAPSTESLLPTLVSRCQRIPFYRLSPAAMAQVLQQTGYEAILSNSPVLAAAQGCPGEAIAAWKQLENIPPELLERLQGLPRSLREALELAQQIDKTLDTADQLWLLNYLQHSYWQQFIDRHLPVSPLQPLENARRYLRAYAQPKLVWEVTLMALTQIGR
ncbi:MAG: DNA polymerase III subunit delta' [Cyanobacteriota bacterium]|nr:DNA polymerase III subunit delta' [Cyanobacteriota bacterium]